VTVPASDIQIKPGLVSRSPFYVSKKPAEFKQTIVYRGDEDFLHVEFPMVHPWLYVLPQQFTIGGEDDRGVRHQQIKVYVQPTHPSFPGGKDVETEIRVNTRTPSGRRTLTIPVYLHDVQPIQDFEGIFAIDFGTSSCCCAYVEHSDGSATVKTIKFDEDGWPPAFDSVGSLIYFADHSNPSAPDYEIGTSAMQAWRGSGGVAEEDDAGDGEGGPGDDAPLSAFKYSVKRYLGTKGKTYVLNNLVDSTARPCFYDYEQLCRLVVGKVIGQAEDELGKKIRKVVATFPTTFSTTQLEALRRVFQSLGFDGDRLNLAYDEANAVALDYFNITLSDNSILSMKAIYPSPSYLLTFDFGGGTLDLAVLQLDIAEAGATHEVGTQVIGVAGAKHFGGDNISLEIFRILKAKVALYVAEAGAEPGDVEDVEAYRGAVEALRSEAAAIKAALAAGRRLDKNSRDIIDDVVPTRYDIASEGGGEQARRHFFELWDAAEHIKKQFGTPVGDGEYPDSVVLTLPLPRLSEFTGIDFSQVGDVAIQAPEYEQRIEPRIRQVLEKARRLLPDREPLAAAILSGNSSRLPIVRRLAQELLHLTPTNVHFDPDGCKVAVARGAAFARRMELVPARIKYRLGNLLTRLPFDLGCKVEGAPFEPFYNRGEELPTKIPYVFEPPTEPRLLHVFARIDVGDEQPEEVGYFDFSQEPSGRELPKALKSAVTKGTARRKKLRPGQRKPPSDAKPITLWVDEDRSVFAERDGRSYALTYQDETFPPEVDPFSGIH